MDFGKPISDEYRAWLDDLEENVIIDEYGYEPGEFTVFPELWEGLYKEGLTPRDAWHRALDAYGQANIDESPHVMSEPEST